MRMLERHIASIDQRLVIVAPTPSTVPSRFQRILPDARLHHHLVNEMQRVRGEVYLQDGAIEQRQLSPGGLHRTPEDGRSWHLLLLDRNQSVTACAWYMQHEPDASFEHLRVRNCPLATLDRWRDTLWRAVETELALARRDRLRYAEVGGWAVIPKYRRTTEGLLLALAAYSLARVMGGALGLTTATVRHSSSDILRRLGGAHLQVNGEAVPPYYDPRYKCIMELLRFDSRGPEPRFHGMIELMKQRLASVPVIAHALPVAAPGMLRAPALPLPQYAA